MISATTVGRINLYKDCVPLVRYRCVELPQLTSYKAIKYVRTVNLKF